MIQKIYVIRDIKAAAYQTPLFTTHLAELQRGLEQAVQKEGIPFNTHTSDFELFQLGTYDTETGQHDLLEKPLHALNLIDLKPKTGE